MDFPIDKLALPISEALNRGVSRFVVAAPTGSGKSTALPVMLQKYLGGQIFVLQPRRVAARMLARSVEKLFDYKGETGWHIRFDKRYDNNTKIVFLTEGILARMLLSNSLPENVSAIIFDEFHERNIYADLSLSLALKFQKTSRKDLKLFACSASVDVDALARYMDASVFECEARLHKIDIRYSQLAGKGLPVWECAAREFARLSTSVSGNFLIFMAGVYEINKTVSKILEMPQSRGMRVLSLYGDMSSEAQDSILNASDARKVIVSTNIAETSLTIDGVDCVIDSGFVKVLRYDFSRVVNTLLVERVSMASATQRAGRAGRMRDGVAMRLWREQDERSFEKFSTSEISRIDLSQIILWLKASGVDLDAIDLFENPPEKSMISAMETLRMLGAIDANGDITRDGLLMARFPSQPRLSKMFVEAFKRGCLADVALVAAVQDAGRIKLELDDERREHERDSMCVANSEPEEIVALCKLARENSFSQDFCKTYGIHSTNARKAFAYAADFYRLARSIFKGDFVELTSSEAIAKCVLLAYPDRVCKRLNLGTLACRLAGGIGCEVRKTSKRYAKDLFVAMSLQETNSATGVSLVADDIVPISKEWLRELFPNDFSERKGARLDEHQKRVCLFEETCYRDLPIEQKISYNVPEDEAAVLLHSKIISGEITLKNFGDDERDFIERVNFISKSMPELNIAPIDEDALSDIFLQMCMGLFSYSEVKEANVMKSLRDWLSGEQLSALDYYLPEKVEISNRRRPVKIRYDASSMRAIVSASFKDLFFFDQKKLVICSGKITPTFEILAPNSRPVQTTQDLETFWKTSWLNVRKELKARYPKHFKATDPF